MKEYTCVACGKQFEKNEEFQKFIIIPRKGVLTGPEDSYVLCREDIELVLGRLGELHISQESILEHLEWREKSARLLTVAQQIFGECSCSDGKSQAEIEALGDDVYDKMCESCWERFSAHEKKNK